MPFVDLWRRWLLSCSSRHRQEIQQPGSSPESSATNPTASSHGRVAMVAARRDHRAVSSTELSVAKSERLQLLDSSQRERWLVRNAAGVEGFVPAGCLRRCRRRRRDAASVGIGEGGQPETTPNDRQAGQERQASQEPEGDMSQKAEPPPVAKADAFAAPPADLLMTEAEAAAADTSATVVATHDYFASQPDEMSLASGDCVLVTERSPDGWWRGRRLRGNSEDATGWFPSNHVKPAASGAGPTAPAAAAPQSPLYRIRALYAFAASHSEELSFAEGDQLDVLEEPPNDPDWLLATIVGSVNSRRGLVPRNYVAVVEQDADSDAAADDESPLIEQEFSLSSLAFYWGHIGRVEADAMLMQLARPGQFLVRAGESNPNDLTLTIRAQEKSRNFKIRIVHESAKLLQSTGSSDTILYHIGQKTFANLSDLVQHYRENPIYRSAEEQCYLQDPFLRSDDLTVT